MVKAVEVRVLSWAPPLHQVVDFIEALDDLSRIGGDSCTILLRFVLVVGLAATLFRWYFFAISNDPLAVLPAKFKSLVS